jgi:hypothetical protein
MREGIYAERLFDFGSCGSEDGFCMDDASVIDQDGRAAELWWSVQQSHI